MGTELEERQPEPNWLSLHHTCCLLFGDFLSLRENIKKQDGREEKRARGNMLTTKGMDLGRRLSRPRIAALHLDASSQVCLLSCPRGSVISAWKAVFKTRGTVCVRPWSGRAGDQQTHSPTPSAQLTPGRQSWASFLLAIANQKRPPRESRIK